MIRVSKALRLSTAFAITFIALTTLPAFGQVSPEEHAKHHPEQAKGGGEKGGGMGGMMGKGGGMMGGGMGDMMEKMGAPKPKELYPKLMDLPDLPMEERTKIQQEAHQRMMDGTKLLSSGLDELAAAAGTDDIDVTDHQCVMARFEGGAPLVFHANTHAAKKQRRWYIAGVTGIIESDFIANQVEYRSVNAPGRSSSAHVL